MYSLNDLMTYHRSFEYREHWHQRDFLSKNKLCRIVSMIIESFDWNFDHSFSSGTCLINILLKPSVFMSNRFDYYLSLLKLNVNAAYGFNLFFSLSFVVPSAIHTVCLR